MSYTSKRQAAVAVILARLEEITVENGFATDAGENVSLGETPQLGPDDPDVALSILVQDDDTGHQGEHIVCQVPIEVHGIVPDNMASPTAAMEALVSDIKRAIEVAGDPARSLGGILVRRGLTRGSTRILRRAAGSEYMGVVVQYVATLGEVWGAP